MFFENLQRKNDYASNNTAGEIAHESLLRKTNAAFKAGIVCSVSWRTYLFYL